MAEHFESIQVSSVPFKLFISSFMSWIAGTGEEGGDVAYIVHTHLDAHEVSLKFVAGLS